MALTDPIADMLTSIRNANRKFQEKVDVPASKIKEEMIKLLRDEGFIMNYKRIDDGKQGVLRVYLKYLPRRKLVINGLRRVSAPGLRIYRRCDQLPKVRNGLGLAILSTPKGIMSASQAKKEKLGGEVLCYIW